ncbi:hypothetical protein N7615_30570, partial [Klebsiella grimontii]|uniref:hypothetical protein n=1 Tax=Klebsiella grimontii TaxID=2058152 RepID=UPI00244B0006
DPSTQQKFDLFNKASKSTMSAFRAWMTFVRVSIFSPFLESRTPNEPFHSVIRFLIFNVS